MKKKKTKNENENEERAPPLLQGMAPFGMLRQQRTQGWEVE